MRDHAHEQIKGVLALDVAWRMVLASADTDGHPIDTLGTVGALSEDGLPPQYIRRGWAWAPCCGLAWLRCLPPEAWIRAAGLIPNREAVIAYCLDYMHAHQCPKAKP